MREVIIASSVRTPVGRAYKGTLRATRPDELAAIAIKGALERVPQLDAKEIEDVILGCAMPEAEQGMNVARIASLRAGLPVEVSALTINRFCSSGLQAIAMAAERIMSGGAEVIVAGGTESMTMIPMGGHKISPNPWLVDHYPDAYLNMGLTAERVGQRFGITREAGDETCYLHAMIDVRYRRGIHLPALDFWLDPADPHRPPYVTEAVLGPTTSNYEGFNPAWGQVSAEQLWGQAHADVIKNGMTPEQAIDKAFKRAEAIFSAVTF